MRTHGLVIDGDYLWSVAATSGRSRRWMEDGKIVGKIQMAKTRSGLHGLEIRTGSLVLRRRKGWVCNLT